jgi:hypothetical protein
MKQLFTVKNKNAEREFSIHMFVFWITLSGAAIFLCVVKIMQI